MTPAGAVRSIGLTGGIGSGKSAVAERLAGVDRLVGHLPMADYREVFREEFRWDTNWKVLAENFMESYHLPVCHAGTIGGASDLNKMECPEGDEAFNHHWIIKNDLVPLALAHPSNTTLTGDDRRITWLLAIYPALLKSAFAASVPSIPVSREPRIQRPATYLW